MSIQKGVHYEYEKKNQGVSEVLEVRLKKGQDVRLESGVMVYLSEGIEVSTEKAAKGLFGSLKRNLAGESFWMNRYTALQDGIVAIAPSFLGELKQISVKKGTEWVVFKNAFMGCSPGLEMSTKYKGIKKDLLDSGHSFQMVCSAPENDEDLFISARGSLVEKELAEGETFILDNQHFVAREGTVEWGHKIFGKGVKGKLFSGEGLVIEARGPGKIILQTRSGYTIVSKSSSHTVGGSGSSSTHNSGGFTFKIG